jgi:PAS domain S-box-containing protein
MTRHSAASTSSLVPGFAEHVGPIFGSDADPIEEVAARAKRLVPERPIAVWEGDAATFEFTYVSDDAVAVFGHPAESWLQSNFWADHVLHTEDRNDAIAYCALATGQCRDHEFEYRARRADGTVRWIYDVVKVIRGPRGVATRLRGLMLDVTAEKAARGEADAPARHRFPALDLA